MLRTHHISRITRAYHSKYLFPSLRFGPTFHLAWDRLQQTTLIQSLHSCEHPTEQASLQSGSEERSHWYTASRTREPSNTSLRFGRREFHLLYIVVGRDCALRDAAAKVERFSTRFGNFKGSCTLVFRLRLYEAVVSWWQGITDSIYRLGSNSFRQCRMCDDNCDIHTREPRSCGQIEGRISTADGQKALPMTTKQTHSESNLVDPTVIFCYKRPLGSF